VTICDSQSFSKLYTFICQNDIFYVEALHLRKKYTLA